MNRRLSALEIVLPILIVAMGLTIAGLQPAAAPAAALEPAIDNSLDAQVAHNVQALIGARGFAAADLADATGQVRPVPAAILGDGGAARIPWTLRDRCYPTPAREDTQATGGSHYWVPLVQRRLTGE